MPVCHFTRSASYIAVAVVNHIVSYISYRTTYHIIWYYISYPVPSYRWLCSKPYHIISYQIIHHGQHGKPWHLQYNCARDATAYQQASALLWRHNGRDSVSNHQPHDCLLNRLCRRRSKKTSKLRVAGLCAGNSPWIGEFSAQMASNAENVSIWWRHHGYVYHTSWQECHMKLEYTVGLHDCGTPWNIYRFKLCTPDISRIFSSTYKGHPTPRPSGRYIHVRFW